MVIRVECTANMEDWKMYSVPGPVIITGSYPSILHELSSRSLGHLRSSLLFFFCYFSKDASVWG
jgi:hypothetical protein